MTQALLLDDKLDLVVPTSWVQGGDLVAQRVRVALSIFRGEDILDQAKGSPVLELLQRGSTDPNAMAAALAATVLAVDGIASVSVESATYNRAGRRHNVQLVAQVDDNPEAGGVEIEARVGAPSQGASPGYHILTRYRGGRVR